MPRKRPPTPLDLPTGPLRLEARRGYADTAVEGGLGPLMQRWSERAARDAVAEPVRQALLDLGVQFGGYAAASPAQREALVHRAEDAIRALERSRGIRGHDPIRAVRELGSCPRIPLGAHVTELHGVREKRAQLLEQLGIRTVGDLLRHIPLRYEDRRRVLSLGELVPGRTPVVVAVEVLGPGETLRRPGTTVSQVAVCDASGPGRLVWFNQPYRATQFRAGTKLVCSGTPRIVAGVMSIHVQECEVVGESPSLHMQRIVPVYPTTAGLTQPRLRMLVDQAVRRTAHLIEDPLPEPIRAARELIPASEARRALHFPRTLREAERARRRETYEELFILQLLLAMRRRLLHDSAHGLALPVDEPALAAFEAQLPFPLTTAQSRVLRAVADDLRSDRPAMRLIHGDVGSGKTVIAAFALLCAVTSGRQAAFMAPTEILAEQHRRVLETLLRPANVRPVLLTGSLPARDKQRIRAGLAAGDIPLVVGTHALVQETTRFADLAVAVVDEQHRFGVLQRADLAAKGGRPHLFVMTATPIPRTLALVLYGDCDVSVLDELPTGRRPPITKVLRKPDRDRAYSAVLRAVAAGQQAFIVCPLIEESESLQADAARRRYEELSAGELLRSAGTWEQWGGRSCPPRPGEQWGGHSCPPRPLAGKNARPTVPISSGDSVGGVRVGLLHGRLRPEIGAAVVEQFRKRELDVLVCTTVIEVGVDVPSATVMVVEDAERFGLAQLHQLRGRVGRGAERGSCYLITSAGPDDPASERLALLERTADGFEVAEADLRLRGPGEFIGTRQAGLPDLRMADLLSDTALIETAREDAFALLASDPTLSHPDHTTLRHLIHHQAPTLLPLMRAD